MDEFIIPIKPSLDSITAESHGGRWQGMERPHHFEVTERAGGRTFLRSITERRITSSKLEREGGRREEDYIRLTQDRPPPRGRTYGHGWMDAKELLWMLG